MRMTPEERSLWRKVAVSVAGALEAIYDPNVPRLGDFAFGRWCADRADAVVEEYRRRHSPDAPKVPDDERQVAGL